MEKVWQISPIAKRPRLSDACSQTMVRPVRRNRRNIVQGDKTADRKQAQAMHEPACASIKHGSIRIDSSRYIDILPNDYFNNARH
jgi:hypothetical protein